MPGPGRFASLRISGSPLDAIRLAEGQIGADGRDVLPGADQAEIKQRALRIADEDTAGEPALAQHEFAVDATEAVPQHDRLRALARLELAGREHADAADLEIG